MRLGGATISHPDKLFWPDEGITKLALAQFYSRIASHDPAVDEVARRSTMERCPEGIRKTCFFQKQAPEHLPPTSPRSRSLRLLPAATSTTSSAARARRC